MTEEDKALVKLLREMQENWKAAYLSKASHVFGQAADRIEAQAAEIERLRGKLALITRIYPQKTGTSAYAMAHIAHEALGETK